MKYRTPVWILAACLASLIAPLPGAAQVTTPEDADQSAISDDLRDLQLARQTRVELAEDVLSGKTTAEDALVALRSVRLSTRDQGEPDVTFAHGAIDVGMRLAGADKRVEADKFFGAAEESLGAVLERTPDDDAAAKVQLLSSRAFVRAQFLGKVPEAMADLDAAQKLAADDEYLEDLRRMLLNDKAAWVNSNSRN